MWLARLAITRPITVSMALLSLLVLGAISLSQLPLNFLPHAEFPFIGVQIPYPNGVPSQTEREIVRPIEEVLATLGGVKDIESYSDADGCFVGVEFDWGRDVNLLRLTVKEKIDQIRPDLPADIQQIFLYTFNTTDIPIVEGRISARDRDLSGSYDLIQRRIVDRLARIPGVGKVGIDGVEPADVSVYLKLDRIKEHHIDVSGLFELLSQSNFNLGLGQITSRGLRYDLRSVSSLQSVQDLENLPIGGDLRLRDVADVVYGSPAMTYGRYLNLEPAIAFFIQKASDANTVDVVDAVRAELALIDADPMLEGVDVLMFFDQAEQIRNSLNGLLQSGALGAVLSVAVLYFFLRRLGATMIVSLATPISIVGTAVFLFLSGRSLNVLSMMGLMLGVGMLIDNAVVVLEAIHGRLAKGENPVEATLNGTREVGRAVASATLTSVVVFAPVVFGGQNELMVWLSEVGITLSVTLLLSLVVSLTVIPMLTAHSLRSDGGHERNRLVATWTKHYERVLRWTAIRHPWVTGLPIALGVVALTAGAIALSGFGPDTEGERGIRRESLDIDYEFSDNSSYILTRRAVDAVQAKLWELREQYGLRDLYSFYRDDYALTRLYFADTSLSEERMRELRQSLRKDMPDLAGVKFRFRGEDGGGGAGAKQFSLTLHGEDSDVLADLSAEVKRRLSLIDSVQDISTNIEQGADELHVHVDAESAERFGLSPQAVSQVLGITFRGVQLPRVRMDRREVDLWVLLQPEDRASIEDLQSLLVSVQDGRDVTLEQVAQIEMAKGPDRITRENQRTAVSVRGAYEGEDFDAALDEIRAAMDALHLPAGYGWNFGDQIVQAKEQQKDMLINALLAIACVYMIMASLFESLRHPSVVMFCMPFASLGVIWLMIVTNTPFNIMAMIGMVILIGVVVNNGIVLIDHVNFHRRHGMSIDEAILAGGRERFRPILMTATTTILGLLPLAIGGGHVGDAEMYPMARAMIGGMLSGTALTLILLPTYYQLSERAAAWRLHRRLLGWLRRALVAAIARAQRLRPRSAEVPSTS